MLGEYREKLRASFFGAILAFAYFVWLQLAFLLLMLFLGSKPLPPASEFIPTLLFTPHGLGLLICGTIVGGILAFVVFSISAISVPLLMTRRLDAVTAINASVATTTTLATARPRGRLLAEWIIWCSPS